MNKVINFLSTYLNNLELKESDGTILSLGVKGNGSFEDYMKLFVIASAQKALDSGTDLSGLTWITIKDKTVTDIDFNKYNQYVKRMKSIIIN